MSGIEEAGYQNQYMNNNSSLKYRPIPKDRKGMEDDWKAVTDHLAEVTGEMNTTEKVIKQLQKQEIGQALQENMVDKQYLKLQQQRLKQIEGEEMIQKRRLDELDRQRQKEEQSLIKHGLANKYEEMIKETSLAKNESKQKKLEEELRLLEQNKRKIEQDRMARQQAKSQMIKETREVLDEMQFRKVLEREEYDKDKLKYRDTVRQNEQREVIREANYKNFYQQCAENQKQLENIHYEKVISPEIAKKRQFDEIVSKNEEEYRQKKLEEEIVRYAKRQNDMQDVKSTLQNQIKQHEDIRYVHKNQYQTKAEQSLQEDYLKQSKLQKNEQQKFYKEYLDQQASAKEEKLKYQKKMDDKEKVTAKEEVEAYEMQDVKLHALIPGYSNSKYIHPYQPEAKYANIISFKEKGNGVRSSLNMMHTQPFDPPRAQLQTTKHTPVQYANNKFTQDFVSQSQKQLNLPDNNQQNSYSNNYTRYKGQLQNNTYKPQDISVGPVTSSQKFTNYQHNPITNPIPFNIQNPYLKKEYQQLATSTASGNRQYFAYVANNNLIQ